jgi:ElaB/YqjD/DUF883 family membrane-anchored ribosome-binding protein
MKNNQDTARTPKELLDELHSLVTEAETMMGDALSEQSAEAIESLRARFAAAQERFTDACAGVQKKVVAGAKCTDATIRANPYQSLAIAAGIGLVVGIFLGRRSK